jgi:hypothetical protein
VVLTHKEMWSIGRRLENEPAPSDRRDRDAGEINHFGDHSRSPETA